MLAQNELLDRLMSGIAQRETGGARDPYGNITNAGGGRRVYGKYQILGANIPAWTKEALGRPLTPAQFLADPEAQDATARTKLGQYMARFGAEGAAQAWLGGPGSVGKVNRRDRFGTSVGQYGRDVLNYAGLAGSPPRPAPKSPTADIIDALLAAPAKPAAAAAPAASPTADIIDGLLAQSAPAPAPPAAQPTANPYDQFDAVPATQAATARNPYDQFDTPPARNPYDQFDTAPAAESTPAKAPAENPNPPAPLSSSSEAQMAGINSALFGVPNMAAAGLNYLLDNGVANAGRLALGRPTQYTPYSGELEQLNQRQNAAIADHPLLYGASALGGMAAVPIRALSVPGKLAALVGPTAARIGMQAAGGALAGGIHGWSEHASPTDAAVGAGLGAVAGPVAGSVVAPAVGAAARFTGDFIRQRAAPAAAAMRMLAKKLMKPGETEQDAETRLTDTLGRFKAAFGRPPSIKELVTLADAEGGEATARDLGAVAARSPESSQIATNQAAAAAIARQREVRNAVTQGQTIPTPPELVAANKELTAKAMGPIRNMRVPLDQDTHDYLQANVLPAVKLGLPASQQLYDELDKGYLRLESIERLRRGLAKLAKSRPGEGFDKLRDDIADLGAQVPGYAQALQDYGIRAQRITGQEAGGQAATVSEGKAPEYVGTFRTARPDEQAGYPIGVREGIAAQTGTPGGTSRIAERLANDTGLAERVRTVAGAPEAARLRNIGQQASTAERGITAATPRLTSEEAASAKALGENIRTGLTAVHGSSTMGLAHVVAALAQKLRLNKGTALKLTQVAGDPRKTAAVLAYLRARGASPKDIVGIQRAIQQTSGFQAGSVAGSLTQ